MQIRIIACLAGGLLGVALTSTVNSALQMSPTLALVGCSLAGITIGYAASIMLDVFAPKSRD